MDGELDYRRLSQAQREVMDWCMDKLQRLLIDSRTGQRIDGWDRATIRAVWESLSRDNPRLRGLE